MQALLALRSMLQLTSADATDLQKFSGLDDSLDTLRMQLDELTSHEEQREYALEVEILRREVHIVFQQKINKVLIHHTLNDAGVANSGLKCAFLLSMNTGKGGCSITGKVKMKANKSLGI